MTEPINTAERYEEYYEEHENAEFFYDYRGHPVRVEYYKGLDVSGVTYPAIHPDGQIPDDEVHAAVSLIAGGDGWWMDADDFRREAEPLGPAADRFENQAMTDADSETDEPDEEEPGDWRDEIRTRSGDGESKDRETCPECGSELRHQLGSDRPACPQCGWEA